MSFGYQVLGFGAFPTRGPGAYVPTHAAVFDGTADYLRYRPNADAKDRTRYTISFWMKRNHPYDTAAVLICNNKNTSGNDYEQLKLNNDDLEYQFAVSGSGKGDRKTYNNFRDPTGWVHIMFVRDVTTTKIYVNGSEANYAATTDPAAGDLGYFTSSEYFVEIGRGNFGGGSIGNYYNGMLAEFIVLDGVAATIGSFGETSSTGEWVPKNPLAGYGTDTQEKNISDWGDLNSVYFNFSDSLNLGKNFRPLDVTVNDATYKIDKSIFFDASDDELTFTPSSANKTNSWTFSAWVKRGTLPGTVMRLFTTAQADNGNDFEDISFDASDRLDYQFAKYSDGTNVIGRSITNMVFRDTTAWYHIHIQRNISLVTVTINGVNQNNNMNTRTNPSTAVSYWGDTREQRIGSQAWNTKGDLRYAGYMTEVVFLNGTASNASNFGGWDANGVWMPIDVSGLTFGTNGFLLQFEGDGGTFDSNADAGGVGADTSGQNNHFTGNGNVHNNRTTMSPTDTSGDNEGNFITWNSIANGGDVTLSEGNFVMTAPNPNANNFVYATHIMRTGKWYMEFGLIKGGSTSFNDTGIHLVDQNFDFGCDGPQTDSSNDSWGLTLEDDGVSGTASVRLKHRGATTQTIELKSSYPSGSEENWDYTNDRLLMAFDADNKKVYFGMWDNDSSASIWFANDGGVDGNPATAANPSFAPSGVTSGEEFTGDGWYLAGHVNDAGDTSNKMRMYSIPSTWSGTAPSGYKALSTFNYTAPTYTDARKYFAPVIYTGTGSSRYVRGCYDSSGTAWTPDWVWIKGRTDASDHALFDCVRDFGTRAIRTSNTTAQDTDSTACQGFFSGGIELGDSSGGSNAVNRFLAAGYTYVAWCWKAGGAPTVDNDNTSGAMDDGSVFKSGTVQTSYTPSGSPSIYPKKMSIAEHGGFSIVKYIGNGSAGATIPHGLDAAADFQIFKRLRTGESATATQDWHVGTNVTGSIIGAELNNPTGTVTAAVTAFNTHTTALAASGVVNDDTDTYISYAFTKTPGLIGIGSYIGAGSDAEPYVVIDDGAAGFRPAWIMIKRTGGTENWYITDAARSPGNLNQTHLLADSANAEASGSGIDFLANGFKVRVTSNSVNANGENIVYLAFSDQAFSLQARAR